MERAYLFPSDDEIRLIYVDTTTSPFHDGERLAPFYFGANKAGGPAYLSAVTLIRPEEERRCRCRRAGENGAMRRSFWEKS